MRQDMNFKNLYGIKPEIGIINQLITADNVIDIETVG